MSKVKKKLDVNDFWNDCLKENNPKKNPSNLKLNSSNTYHNKTRRNRRLYRHDTNPTFLGSKIIQKALISEENTRAENNKAINDSIEYMVSLYNRAKASQEKKKKKIIQSKEKHLTLEKETCSFKPKQYKNKKMQKKSKKNFREFNYI